MSFALQGAPVDLFDIEPKKTTPKIFFDKDFSLDFDEVVPLFYTNILLVEDDSMTINFIKNSIKRILKTPARIRSFMSAEKTVEYLLSLRKHHLPGPDIAIVDYLLTGESDGLDVCKILEKKFPETQVFLMSSTPYEKLKGKMDAIQTKPIYIQKPFEPTLLQNLFN
jgi:response regulator RpfG family c-di-GMP phosphodiesterase